MDIVAHSLWAGLSVLVLKRHRPVAHSTAVATVALAALPDLLQLLPLLGWVALGGGSVAALLDYVRATPGLEPGMPPLVTLLSHHAHCVTHSAVVAGAVTALLWAWQRRLCVPLLGWWSHIVIDVPTHSADYYPVPVFYPFTEWAWDGVAWTQPWMLALNYGALAAAAAWLWFTGRRPTEDRP